MTWSDIATIIPFALGVAFSPVAIIEMILVLFSKRRVLNSIVFVVALAILNAVGLILGGLGSDATGTTEGKPSLVSNIVLVVFAAFLLFLAITNFAKRKDVSEPKVFQAIGNMGPIPVALLSFGATLINPKNLPLLLGSGDVVAATAAPWLVGIIFVIISTSPYWIAMLISVFGGEGARRVLDAWRVWLIRYNRIIMFILCGLVGLIMAAKAIF